MAHLLVTPQALATLFGLEIDPTGPCPELFRIPVIDPDAPLRSDEDVVGVFRCQPDGAFRAVWRLRVPAGSGT